MVDGAHISTLLLTFFYRFTPDLINEGYVYRAMPPLYKAKTSKSETYLYTDEELEKYRKTHKNFELQRYKGYEVVWPLSALPLAKGVTNCG